jgi:tRNA A37 threonylcarbamoyladenosine dehydratase
MSEPSSVSNEPGAAYPARFARLVDLHGAAGFARIRAARVTVVGLGGVGSHTAHALARSGVGRLVLVDFDRVTESSLNRNPLAGPDDVGRLKIEVIARELARTCPDTEVATIELFVDAATVARALDPRPDFVADAIDSVGPKTALLAHCVRAGVPVASCMAASARRDIGRIRVADLAETAGCPLARRVRKGLAGQGIRRGIACVFSDEPAPPPLPPDEAGRKRLPSQIALPGAFGYALAACVLDALARGSEGVTTAPETR